MAGLLAQIPEDEARTRWHLSLVVPRIARTHRERLRAARLMTLMAKDRSNLVRCSAVEGMATLACADSAFRDEAEEMAEQFLRIGTPAMKSRARRAAGLMARRVSK